MESFCSQNQVLPELVDKTVLDTLNGLKTVSDAIRSSLFHKENKTSLLKLYRKAQTSDTDRHWMTPGTSAPLIKARETESGQPFDACPLYLLHFVVSSNGDLCFQQNLRLFHSVMYDRIGGGLL